ncbi:MAG TPA: PSD1 and planctomycete cytochrome C domain-containing protein [Pirellulaceae bacterium]|jgi:mono/diheme cytochrome c family protein
MRRLFQFLAIFALLSAALASRPIGTAAADRVLSFNRDIRPILSGKCFACHGFDAKKREAELRLDTAEGATAEHEGVRAIVPSDLAKSALWRRINSTDEDEVMPPPASKKTLTSAEKAILKQWIEQGAPYQKHWAFEPIMRPPVSAVDSGLSPIDVFLDQQIQAAGLAKQPEADRETLMRRVSFALTGLPPTVEDLDRFLPKDNYYEAYIDHLLSSPRYGEEMARHWLDVARYADTHGLHLDNERQMWPYRDWVIKAFNDNLPYDQFTVWQVAGDLLPSPTTEQLVATGFNRCNVTTSEGGSIAEEYVYRYAVERASTLAQAWLGLTAGCAVCHDHKYDPISAKEFYSLYAFFQSNADPAMDGNSNVTAPFLKLPDKHQKSAAAAAAKVEHVARSWLDALAADVAYNDPAEAKPDPARKEVSEVLFDDAFPLGSISKSSSRNAIVTIVDPPFQAASGRRVIRQAFASNLTDTIEFKLRPIVVPENGRIECQVRVEPQDLPKSFAIGLGTAGKRAVSTKSVGWVRDGDRLVRKSGPKDHVVTPGQWAKLLIKTVDLGLKPGDTLGGLSLQQNGGVCYWDDVRLVGEANPASDPLESLSAWRKSVGTTLPPELPAELNDIIKGGPSKKLSEEEAAKLRQFYVALIARPASAELEQARVTWETARAARMIAEESAPGTFIFRDLEKPRESFVMMRGQYDKPGEKVEPNVPAILPPIKNVESGRRLTRLDLAQWLVGADNPLTARVAVNRLWQQLFGTGLVKTSYDFGSQGEPPSHPELLDWLAADFRDNGWDVKRFTKQLVMSQAFRRSAVVTPDMLTKDPQNRLYARGPRVRLDAEQVRDNALFVSGLINLKMGGPGVKTYQPPNIWEPVGYSDSNTRFYLQDHGSALYRRSIYAFLKRTAPPPFMSNFDGPNREQVCTVRERSNTPLQALQLMNDTQHFEAARGLAERLLAEGGSTDENRIAWLYRTILSRQPLSEESALVNKALTKQRDVYRADIKAAEKAIQVGESSPKNIAPADETAAWTMIANLLLNLDETVCRN